MSLLLGVMGDPIGHSLSPLIHNSWLREAAIPATYEAMQVASGELGPALAVLRDRGALGVNVTLPHKQAALALSSTASQTARRIGAANTLTLGPDGLWNADNTDVAGFLKALDETGCVDLEGVDVTVVGAGGSARAVVHALHLRGAIVTILNRTLERAAELRAELGGPGTRIAELKPQGNLLVDSRLVVNTTSIGHGGGILNLGEGNGRLFFDISYGKACEAQLKHARERGWRTADGLGMLVGQAAESFSIWFGEHPDTRTALTRCRAVLEAPS